MFGQFRAYERNGDLIFIDERGAVYFGLGEEHRLVAQISGWPNQRHEGEEFILLQQGDGGPITPCIVNDTDAQPMEVVWQDEAMRYLFEADIPEQIQPLVRQCYDVLRDSE